MPISLSTSQQRLIRLIAMGTTDIEIARKMALTPDQMQKAFATLCAQFNVADRVELILQIWSSDGSGKKKNKRRGFLNWLAKTRTRNRA